MLLFIIAAIIYIGVILFIAQQKAPVEYSVKENTISELGCQTYDERTIMQWGFKGFGIILLTGILFSSSDSFKELHFTIPLGLYALGMFLSGIFSAKPFEHLVFYSIKESKIHSFCSNISGFAFSSLVVMKFIMSIGITNRVLNLLMIIFILYFSVQTGRSTERRGIYQRILYFGCFIWLTYAYSGMMG